MTELDIEIARMSDIEAKNALKRLITTLSECMPCDTECPVKESCEKNFRPCDLAWLDFAKKTEPRGRTVTEELKPCPRCKSTSLHPMFLPEPFDNDPRQWAIHCDECQQLGKFAETLEEAMRLWNQRSED